MELAIWNKIEIDNIDVIFLKGLIKVMINDKVYFIKEFEDIEEGRKIYNELLDKIEEINEAYYNNDEEQFKELSEKFLEELKLL